MRAKRLVLTALLALPSVVRGADVDEERSAWRYKREVALPAPAETPLVTLELPPEVMDRSRGDLSDLRLVGDDGVELPYVLERAEERTLEREWTGRLVDTRSEKRVRTVWVVDLESPRSFDRVVLDLAEGEFAKRLRVEVSDDAQAWRVARDDAGIFDRPWNGRLRWTTVALAEPATARYLRVTADDRRSFPVTVRGLRVAATRRVAGQEWRRPLTLLRVSQERPSRYRLEPQPGPRFESLELEADDPAFARRVRLRELRDVNGRREEVLLAEGDVFRLRIEDEALAVECLSLPIQQRPVGGELRLEIEDRDSPPLRHLRGVATGATTRLVFPAAAGPRALYYGNETTRAPLYDLEALSGRLAFHPPLQPAVLGLEHQNPRYRKAPPLPFAAARGAAAEVTRWAAVRRFTIAGGEDLYTISLAPADLPLLRRDLADLRVVDVEDRQVPSIVVPEFAERRVPLVLTREAAERKPGARSRYRLHPPPGPDGVLRALPLAALELSFSEPYFLRPAKLLARAPEQGRGERTAFSGRLERVAEAKGPVVLALDGLPAAELALEIDEGDNAPLTLQRAQGVVRVPRVAFKAGPGAYRLLLGNGEAPPPRYDIAGLRQEVLAYSALRVEATPVEPNPAYRRRALDYFKNAPPMLLLWGALAAAVVVLLLLTARIVKAPATGS